MRKHRKSSIVLLLAISIGVSFMISACSDAVQDKAADIHADSFASVESESKESKIIPTESPVPKTEVKTSPLPTETPVPTNTPTAVPSSAEVVDPEDISFAEEYVMIHIDETLELKADLLPDDTTEKHLNWTSSDESIVTVSETGKIKGVSFGEAEITAVTSNGLSATCSVKVAYAQRDMEFKYSSYRDDDNNIGSEWQYVVKINGESAKEGTVTLHVGDVLEFYVNVTEHDIKPDIGENTVTRTVTEEDLEDGFTIEVEVTVTENAGRNYGKSAHFVYEFVYTVEDESD